MADYYPLLAKAVEGLPDSTADARHAIYERARGALFGQLRNLDPPVPEDVIEREAQALERAVAQIETEISSRSGFEGGAPSVEPGFARPDSPPGAFPANTRGSGPRPRSDSPSGKPAVAPARTPRPPPLLKVRRDPRGAAAPPPEPEPLSSPNAAPAVRASMRGDTGVSAGGRGLDDPTAMSGPGFLPVAESASGYEPFAPEASGTSAEHYESTAGARLEAQRPFAQSPGKDTGSVKRAGIVAGITGLLIVLVAIAAYKLRDRPEDLVRLQPATVQGETGAGTGGKIADRVDAGNATPGTPAASAGVPSTTADRNEPANNGAAPGNTPLPVARRAALLIESPEEQSKVKTFLGTVVWRVDNVSNGPDESLAMAVRAEVDIPEEKLQAVLIIQKNFDSTLPASHTIKLRISVPPDSALANIKQISVLQMRREDTPAGETLKGITVPVTDNSFLIGLSRGDSEAANLDLLRSREWFDIPMVLANGRVAKLTFEKGQSGRGALDDALASWQTKQ